MSDWRAKLSAVYAIAAAELRDPQVDYMFLPEIVFPYTPNISSAGRAVSYEQYDFSQSVYNQYSFKNSKMNDITIDAKFTANTASEAEYFVRTVFFLRTFGTTAFGIKDPKKDKIILPPTLHFSYMGAGMFQHIPVVLSGHSISFTNDVDYVPVVVNQKEFYVPTFAKITINLLPQYSTFRQGLFTNEDAFDSGYNRGYYQ